MLRRMIRRLRREINSSARKELMDGLEGAFNLIESGMLEEDDEMPEEWKEGYRQCMVDVLEAVALGASIQLPTKAG